MGAGQTAVNSVDILLPLGFVEFPFTTPKTQQTPAGVVLTGREKCLKAEIRSLFSQLYNLCDLYFIVTGTALIKHALASDLQMNNIHSF